MLSKKIISLIGSMVIVVTFSGCSMRLIDFTVISSKNVNLKIDKSQGIRVSGNSNGFLGVGASIKDAMDNALMSAGPDYDLLIDGVVRVNDYVFVSGYRVEGTAVSTTKMKAMMSPAEYEAWCKTYKLNFSN
jgi:hypothetical protein